MKEAFDHQIRDLALTLRPGSIAAYQVASRRFLNYLAAFYPGIYNPSELRRDPHILGYMRVLCEKTPPLKNSTRSQYLIYLRRLLLVLAPNQEFIVPNDFPRIDKYLPKSLSPENDRLLDFELRKNPDIIHSGLLLLRATGMRIGECLSLTTDCLHHLGCNEWALHVPLGKLHSERWIPVNDEICKLVAHIASLRSSLDSAIQEPLRPLLFPFPVRHLSRCAVLRRALVAAARRAGCSTHVSPHKLRHTYATEMLRAGMSLPSLKVILGHSSIRMTMRYIAVTQTDLQQQYFEARQKIEGLYCVPKLPAKAKAPLNSDLETICASLVTARHMMEMYRRNGVSRSADKKLHRLMNRISAVLKAVSNLNHAPK
jgi:site-specific recombinase XerD